MHVLILSSAKVGSESGFLALESVKMRGEFMDHPRGQNAVQRRNFCRNYIEITGIFYRKKLGPCGLAWIMQFILANIKGGLKYA
jgi:hypothetical protein